MRLIVLKTVNRVWVDKLSRSCSRNEGSILSVVAVELLVNWSKNKKALRFIVTIAKDSFTNDNDIDKTAEDTKSTNREVLSTMFPALLLDTWENQKYENDLVDIIA